MNSRLPLMAALPMLISVGAERWQRTAPVPTMGLMLRASVKW
jgi:hypothetical protein